MKRPLPIHKELFQPFWSMTEEAYNGYKDLIRRNRELGLEFDEPLAHELPYLLALKSAAANAGADVADSVGADVDNRLVTTSRVAFYERCDMIEDDDQVINMIPVLGPVMSESTWCVEGMRELAARLVYADNHKNVIGHFVLLDTPGGSARADELSIALANCKKPVIGLVRGMCASKGIDIANHIKTVYAERESCLLGSVGVMCNMYGIKDKTEKDGVVYRSMYSKHSTEKNKAYRDAINGDDKAMMGELDKLAEGFMARTKKRWPKCTEAHLHGATFEAHELDGVFHDGYRSYSECIYELFDRAGVEPHFNGLITEYGILPASKQAEFPEEDPEELPTDDPERDIDESHNGPDTNQTSQTLTNTSEASDSAIPAEASAQEDLRNTQEKEQPESGADASMDHGSSAPDVVETDTETAPEATAQNQNSINNQNQTRMKDFYEKIPGVGVVATNEDGSLALTVAQNQVIATYMAAQSATIAQMKQDAEAKEKEIEELADRTEVPSAQAVPQNNNAGEQTAQGVDGPIATHADEDKNFEVLRKHAQAFGLMR